MSEQDIRKGHQETCQPGHTEDVRAALRDAVLALGGVIAVRAVADDLVRAFARAFGAVVRRHISSDAGTSQSMSHATRLRPHPAIVELLTRIGARPKTSPPPEHPRGDREWLRLPGLFRRWEIEQVIEVDEELHIEPAGRCEEGTPVFAVYARSIETREETR